MVAWLRAGSLAILLCLVATAVPSDAVTTTGYAAWDPLTGTANNYTTAMRLPAQGFPEASVTSDSRAGSVGIISGATSWAGENTPVGLVYGSGRNQPYLSLRPKADNAASPSITTYEFAHPTPPTGWMVALGDIDADQVRVSAKDAAGAEVSVANLGFQGGFNYCDTTPRPSSCSSSIGDVPTWNPATQTLTGNPQGLDTVGATGWFEPSVSLSSLTLEYTRRVGFPTYSTSFASLARTISGTVDDVSGGAGQCPVTGVTVRLVGPYGDVQATTRPDATGAYSFGQYATQPGYRISVEPSDTCVAVGAATRTVSNATSDATADFSVRRIIPQPVSGTVTAAGQGLSDVNVTLHAPGGGTKSTTTDADGNYLFDDDAIGEGYFVTIDVPAGYNGPNTRAPFAIDDAPITGQDFALSANPAVSGQVTGGGAGLGAVTVTLTPAQGPPLTTVTAADGTYSFDLVPPGTYDISVQPTEGYNPAPALDGVVVADADVTGQDFALTRPGALGGEVTDESGATVGDATVTVAGPATNRVLTTDADGAYFLDGLQPGTYQIELTPPDGFAAVGTTTRSVTITDAGEIRGGQDFTVQKVTESPSPTPTPSASPTGPGSAPGTGAPALPDTTPGGATTSGGLPDTGTPVGLPMLLGGLALVLAGAILVGGARLRRE